MTTEYSNTIDASDNPAQPRILRLSISLFPLVPKPRPNAKSTTEPRSRLALVELSPLLPVHIALAALRVISGL
jgi:hypothetical protein